MNISKKISQRIISLLMVFVMLVTILPNNLIPNISADESYGNMTSGLVELKPGSGAGSVSWTSNLNSMHGYKISVWYAVLDPERTKQAGEPVYKWDSTDKNECFQIGRNIYFRDSYLATKSGSRVSPDFWGKGNIFELTTLGNT